MNKDICDESAIADSSLKSWQGGGEDAWLKQSIIQQLRLLGISEDLVEQHPSREKEDEQLLGSSQIVLGTTPRMWASRSGSKTDCIS